MTDRELMQQALDALDLVADLTSYDDEVYEAIDALRARLAQPEQESAYGYASRLATAIWEKHYKDESPHWKVNDSLLGVLTQIDNMTTGLVRAQSEQEFNPDWDAMAVMVEEQQRMAKRIEELKERLLQVELNPPTARLAQPEPEPVATLFGSLPVYDVPPPEQEPVAWMVITMGEVTSMQPHMIAAEMLDGTHQLYTAPPQREWQGLTDEEMRKTVDGYFEFDGGDMWGSYRAIEAKLKAKNAL